MSEGKWQILKAGVTVVDGTSYGKDAFESYTKTTTETILSSIEIIGGRAIAKEVKTITETSDKNGSTVSTVYDIFGVHTKSEVTTTTEYDADTNGDNTIDYKGVISSVETSTITCGHDIFGGKWGKELETAEPLLKVTASEITSKYSLVEGKWQVVKAGVTVVDGTSYGKDAFESYTKVTTETQEIEVIAGRAIATIVLTTTETSDKNGSTVSTVYDIFGVHTKSEVTTTTEYGADTNGDNTIDYKGVISSVETSTITGGHDIFGGKWGKELETAEPLLKVTASEITSKYSLVEGKWQVVKAGVTVVDGTSYGKDAFESYTKVTTDTEEIEVIAGRAIATIVLTTTETSDKNGSTVSTVYDIFGVHTKSEVTTTTEYGADTNGDNTIDYKGVISSVETSTITGGHDIFGGKWGKELETAEPLLKVTASEITSKYSLVEGKWQVVKAGVTVVDGTSYGKDAFESYTKVTTDTQEIEVIAGRAIATIVLTTTETSDKNGSTVSTVYDIFGVHTKSEVTTTTEYDADTNGDNTIDYKGVISSVETSTITGGHDIFGGKWGKELETAEPLLKVTASEITSKYSLVEGKWQVVKAGVTVVDGTSYGKDAFESYTKVTTDTQEIEVIAGRAIATIVLTTTETSDKNGSTVSTVYDIFGVHTKSEVTTTTEYDADTNGDNTIDYKGVISSVETSTITGGHDIFGGKWGKELETAEPLLKVTASEITSKYSLVEGKWQVVKAGVTVVDGTSYGKDAFESYTKVTTDTQEIEVIAGRAIATIVLTTTETSDKNGSTVSTVYDIFGVHTKSEVTTTTEYDADTNGDNTIDYKGVISSVETSTITGGHDIFGGKWGKELETAEPLLKVTASEITSKYS